MEEKKKRLAKSGLRGVARFCALQKLYETEFETDFMKDSGSVEKRSPKEDYDAALLSDSIEVSEMDKVFLRELLKACYENLLDVDQVIQDNLSKTWNIKRLDPVTKGILRLGITELMCFPKTPDSVIFNEYIEVAKAFFETPEVSFINGLLNKAGAKLRSEKKDSAEEKEKTNLVAV